MFIGRPQGQRGEGPRSLAHAQGKQVPRPAIGAMRRAQTASELWHLLRSFRGFAATSPARLANRAGRTPRSNRIRQPSSRVQR